jgi:hypothetical protein
MENRGEGATRHGEAPGGVHFPSVNPHARRIEHDRRRLDFRWRRRQWMWRGRYGEEGGRAQDAARP